MYVIASNLVKSMTPRHPSPRIRCPDLRPLTAYRIPTLRDSINKELIQNKVNYLKYQKCPKDNKKLTISLIHRNFKISYWLKRMKGCLYNIYSRYRYLVKNGAIKKMENGGNIIFSELPQIPGIWVCYRRPHERNNNLEKLCLDCLDLCHMPLLEGEEKLKILTYQHNRIPSI